MDASKYITDFMSLNDNIMGLIPTETYIMNLGNITLFRPQYIKLAVSAFKKISDRIVQEEYNPKHRSSICYVLTNSLYNLLKLTDAAPFHTVIKDLMKVTAASRYGTLLNENMREIMSAKESQYLVY